MAKRVKEEKSEVDNLIADLEKKYGLSRSNPEQPKVVSSGSISINQATGIGGIPVGKLIEIFGMESGGKAQPLTSKILTPYGWKNMQDMEIGTIVSTPDGGNSTVIGIYPQGEMDVYKITFDDKSSTKCTLDHLWYVKGRISEKGEILSTQEIIKNGFEKSTGVRTLKIPTTNPVHFEQYGKITIDPYLLGILIGDGGLTDTSNAVKFTTCDPEILNEISIIIKRDYDNIEISNKMGKCGYYFKKKQNKNRWNKNEIFLQLEALNLMGKYSYEKHIPKEYLLTSIENRIALFQGLMDSDGTSQNNKNSLSYSSSSIKLSEDFQFLCRSLGMRCTTSSKPSKYKNSSGKYVDCLTSYRSNLLFNTFEFQPFRLTRKKVIPYKSEYSDRFIESIEYIGKEECQCIAIGHPDELYITDDFIVTHNTTITLHAISEFQKAFPAKKVALFDYEHAFDKKYAKSIGVDVENLLIYQPDNMESGYDLVLSLVENDLVSLIVLDSQTAALPKAVIDGDIGDATIGLAARINSKFCGKIKGLLDLHQCTLISISQTRANIGGMSSGDVSTGGNAWKFYADQRWKVWKLNDKENELNKMTVDIIKNKNAQPFGQGKVSVLWGIGYDKIGEIVDYAVEFDLIKKGGAGWYTFREEKIQGMENMKIFLDNNPDVLEYLKNEVNLRLK